MPYTCIVCHEHDLTGTLLPGPCAVASQHDGLCDVCAERFLDNARAEEKDPVCPLCRSEFSYFLQAGEPAAFASSYGQLLNTLGVPQFNQLVPGCYPLRMLMAKYGPHNRFAVQMAAAACRSRRQYGASNRVIVLSALVLIHNGSQTWWHVCGTLPCAFVVVARHAASAANADVIVLACAAAKTRWFALKGAEGGLSVLYRRLAYFSKHCAAMPCGLAAVRSSNMASAAKQQLVERMELMLARANGTPTA